MANLLLINILLKGVAVILIKLQNTIKKLRNIASSIVFMKKALSMLYLYLQKGQFLNEENRIKSSQNILKSHFLNWSMRLRCKQNN